MSKNRSFLIHLAGWYIPLQIAFWATCWPVAVLVMILTALIGARERRLHNAERARIAREQAAWGGFYRVKS